MEYTREEIENAPYQKLVGMAAKGLLGVKYSYQKKDELRSLLLEAFDNHGKQKKADSEKPTDKTAKDGTKSDEKAEKSNKPKSYGKRIMAIVDDQDLSKSERMRRVYDLGVESPAEIARLLQSHYSFVYGVIQRHLRKD